MKVLDLLELAGLDGKWSSVHLFELVKCSVMQGGDQK